MALRLILPLVLGRWHLLILRGRPAGSPLRLLWLLLLATCCNWHLRMGRHYRRWGSQLTQLGQQLACATIRGNARGGRFVCTVPLLLLAPQQCQQLLSASAAAGLRLPSSCRCRCQRRAQPRRRLGLLQQAAHLVCKAAGRGSCHLSLNDWHIGRCWLDGLVRLEHSSRRELLQLLQQAGNVSCLDFSCCRTGLLTCCTRLHAMLGLLSWQPAAHTAEVCRCTQLLHQLCCGQSRVPLSLLLNGCCCWHTHCLQLLQQVGSRWGRPLCSLWLASGRHRCCLQLLQQIGGCRGGLPLLGLLCWGLASWHAQTCHLLQLQQQVWRG